jgi:hypothetical protein
MTIKTAHWNIQAPWRVYFGNELVATVILRDREVGPFKTMLEDETVELVLEAYETGRHRPV